MGRVRRHTVSTPFPSLQLSLPFMFLLQEQTHTTSLCPRGRNICNGWEWDRTRNMQSALAIGCSGCAMTVTVLFVLWQDKTANLFWDRNWSLRPEHHFLQCAARSHFAISPLLPPSPRPIFFFFFFFSQCLAWDPEHRLGRAEQLGEILHKCQKHLVFLCCSSGGQQRCRSEGRAAIAGEEERKANRVFNFLFLLTMNKMLSEQRKRCP